MNLYAYAGNNPVAFSDPFGLCPEDAGGDGKTPEFSDCPEGTSGYYAHLDASGHGGFQNDVKGAVAACKESTGCRAAAVVGLVVTGRAIARDVGSALFKAGGLANSNRYLRTGIGRHGGRKVFRLAGRVIQKVFRRDHIDLLDLGPWGQ